MSNSKTCAYCGQSGDLTKDHVWPKCFLNRRSKKYAHFSPTSQKVHSADYVVKDVCKNCNNGPLSTVDTYFCNIYDMLFSINRDNDHSVSIAFDYDMLLRAFLKISYNSSRGATPAPWNLAVFSGYILGTAQRPKNIAMYGEILGPYKTSVNGKKKVLSNSLYRSISAQTFSSEHNNTVIRIIIVNSFCFYVVASLDPSNVNGFLATKDELKQHIGHVTELSPLFPNTTLYYHGRNSWATIMPQIQANAEQYYKFFAPVDK